MNAIKEDGTNADRMETTSAQTDRALGLTLLGATLAVIGALLMLVGAPAITAAWGFAAAMVFSTLVVVAIHVYE